MTNPAADVLIIGAGAVGVCAAYALHRRGARVVVLDRGAVGAGSSYGNAGALTLSHCLPLAAPGAVNGALRRLFDADSPVYIRPRLDLELWRWLWRFRAACTQRRMERGAALLRDLILAGLPLFTRWAEREGLEFGLERRGLTTLYRSEKAFAQGVARAKTLRELGVEVEILSAAETAAQAPALGAEAVGGALFPQDGHLDPRRFVAQLAERLQRDGASFYTGAEVIDFTCGARGIERVHTTRGDFSAAVVVLAAGAQAPLLARRLGLKLPIQPAKGYSVTFDRPPGVPATPILLDEAKVYITPMGDRLRFAGTLELAGHDMTINRRRVQAILDAVPRYLRGLAPATLKRPEIWRGLRPCTPDGLPFLGRSQRIDNLIVAAGHAMIGVTLAPITGRLVAQLVAQERPEFDLDLLAVERYGG